MIERKKRTPDLQNTKCVVVNKTSKVEVHMTDNQFWNDDRVVSDHEVIFNSALQPKKHNTLCSCTMAAYFSPKAWCPCSPDAEVNLSAFCTDLRLEFGSKTIPGISMAS